MAILFFDGFDRYTTLKDFDRNYWSFQPMAPVAYKRYAFGGYSYNHDYDGYSERPQSTEPSSPIQETEVGYYAYYSPNNATLPSAKYMSSPKTIQYDIFSEISYSGNSYPGFGSPPGFLALHNLDITDPNLEAPITYVQLSGFPFQRENNESFLCARILGIETKHQDYIANDEAGRYGEKHPIVAFCSGDAVQLMIAAVKYTANHLSTIEGEKMTIGLEVIQNDGVSGVFDMNLFGDVSNYQIRSVYSIVNNYKLDNLKGKVLCIDKNVTELGNVGSLGENLGPLSPISRWCHFQFGIIQTGTVPYIKIKVENMDLLSIPADDTIDNKDQWLDYIDISGFNYDNVRFFNRTYDPSINFGSDPDWVALAKSRYYMLGAVTLLDDIVLSDSIGVPSGFLGANTRIIPFSPGVSGNVSGLPNTPNYPDGPSGWLNLDTSSNRIALKNYDGDDGKITSVTSGDLTAVRYTDSNYPIDDANSIFRFRLDESIGGLKFYTQAKKLFLDTSYQVVIQTGDLNDEVDGYMGLGPVQNLTKTRYGQPYQFYEYNNPHDGSPWTTGMISPESGIVLGVKKL